METTVKQRLIEFIEYKKISIRAFERMIGVSNGYIKALKKSPTTDKMLSIIRTFPELNQNWLLTGEGEMLNADVHQVAVEQDKKLTNEKNGAQYYTREDGQLLIRVPLVPHSALGSTPDEFAQILNDHEFEMVEFTADRIGHGKYYAFEVDGDSMDNGTRHSFHRGDRVLVRELDKVDWMPKLRYNQWPYWVVVFGNNVRLKQITDQQGTVITLHSLNPSPEYCDFRLDLSDVSRLFNVLEVQPVPWKF